MGTTTTNFNYDGFGSRLKKTTGASKSLYPFGDEYEITDGVLTKYITVEGLGVIAKRVGYGPGAETYWLHSDRLGSIAAVTTTDGLVELGRTYRPYGEILGEAGNHTESRGWIDQRNDPKTGLTYLHARYYDPQAGVFLSPDPIGVAGGMNAYGYGFGDPVNLADRGGLTPLSSPLDGGGGIPGWAWWLAGRLLGGGGGDAEPCPLSNPLCQALDDMGLIIHECGGFPDACAPPPAPDPPEPIDITVVFLGPEEPPGEGGGSRPSAGVTLVDSLIYHGAQISAGFGDTLTWGATDWARDKLFEELLNWETTDAVSTDSAGYHVGEIGAIAHGIASGGAAGLRAAGSKMAGREFSHWIPNRFLKRFDSRFLRKTFGRSPLNGNYVTPARHYMHDPFRYPRGWKLLGDRLPAWLAQLDRTPWVLRGAVFGATWGEGSRRHN
jgi:RHS repeat-associated protein